MKAIDQQRRADLAATQQRREQARAVRREAVLRAHGGGCSVPEIAMRLRLSKYTVREVLREAGVSPTPARDGLSLIDRPTQRRSGLKAAPGRGL